VKLLPSFADFHILFLATESEEMSSDGLSPYPKMVGIDWSILSVVEVKN